MAWTPLRRLRPEEINPEMDKINKAAGLPPNDETWWSPTYQVVVRYLEHMDKEIESGPDGMVHLSIHSHDRAPMRNWRHLQQIKNEVCGEDRFAFEVFPPEDRLVDTSNEYHLWVLPKGTDLPFAFQERLVSSDEQAEAFTNDPSHGGRQEPWEEGLTTGGDRNENPIEKLDAMKSNINDRVNELFSKKGGS